MKTVMLIISFFCLQFAAYRLGRAMQASRDISVFNTKEVEEYINTRELCHRAELWRFANWLIDRFANEEAHSK